MQQVAHLQATSHKPQATTITFILFCWPSASSTQHSTKRKNMLHHSRSTTCCDATMLYHNRRLWCSILWTRTSSWSTTCSIGVANAAFHCEFQCTTTELWCIGVRSAGESCRSHKVRCLHLTVNSQWKLFTFTPKRSFGVKTV